MDSKILINHGCWAAVVAAAFYFGSQRGSSPSEGDAGNTELRRPSLSALPGADPSFVPGNVSDKSDQLGWSESSGDDLGGSTNWALLAEQAVMETDPLLRRLAFSRLLEALRPENAMAIREQLVAFGAGGDMWRDFNYAWGALAGEEAVIFAASSEESDLGDTLKGWASANPNDAVAFLDNLPENMRGSRDNLAASIVAGLADRGMDLATDLVLRLSGEGIGNAENLIGIVAQRSLSTIGVDASAQWSESLPDGALKGAAMNSIARAYVRQDPEAAAQWVGGFAGQEYAANVVEEVADGWAERNPVAAVSWLESLPEGRGQVAGLTSVFGDWEDRDPAAASQYLLSMPLSDQRDSAISGFSRGYAWQDPEAAIAWAQDIGDPSLRTSTLERAGRAYFRRDPESARTWLQNSGLSAESQQQILESDR